MKRPNARPLRLTIDPGGGITAVVRGGAQRAGLERVAIVLDGAIQAVLGLEPGPRGTTQFAWKLPSATIHRALDVLALPNGDSLLGLPLELAGTYGLNFGTLGLEGPFITGAFTAAPFLAADLGVDFWADGKMAAQGVAHRSGGGVPPSWQFRVGLHSLLRPHETLALTPRVAGLALTAPQIIATPQAIGLMGCLDAASPAHVEGWVVDLADPKRRVAIDVVVDAETVATTLADAHRPDIKDAGLGEAACGFRTVLPPHADPNAIRRIAVRLAGARTELAGSPQVIDPVPGTVGMFDTLHGMCAHGWALNRAAPEVPVEIEVIGPGGEILGRGPADQFRGDLLDANLNAGLCAFKIDLAAHFDRLIDQELFARVAGTDHYLAGSPRRVTVNRNIRRFARRRQALRPGVLPRLRSILNRRAGADAVSFIMPVHNPPRAWLIEALESVRGQFCDHWELICVDDGSTEAYVGDILAGYATRDKRIRVLRSADNVGIARAVNFGLRAAAHGLVAFLDHDDRLEPDAAWQLIRAAQMTGAELFYSDEALTTENIEAITELRLRPAFSHDYYLSHPYFVHLICARTAVARQIGGWNEAMEISADVDFVLRMIEAARAIAHIPAVLYRWRTHEASTGHTKQDAVMQATAGALQRHLDRLHTGASVAPGVWFNQFRIDWPASRGRVLIVIPTKNQAALLRKAVESIERTCKKADYRLVVIDHASDDAATQAYLETVAVRHCVMPYAGAFNFSAMNNAAVAAHGEACDFTLFLNNDIEATQDGWLDRMRRLANRADVGAVGALLMYADRTVQHAGVVLGFNESADHALKFQPVFLNDAGRRNLGYNCALTATRDYAAVTAACLMMRRALFTELGGFDEDFAIGFNDTDLCLRIQTAGYRILYDGTTIFYHYESATRSQTKQVFHPDDTRRMVERWGHKLRGGDDFYNPNLSLKTQDHVPREDEGCRIVHAPRVTLLALDRIAQASNR